jgi:peptide/nickel transport system substrate-binding protein
MLSEKKTLLAAFVVAVLVLAVGCRQSSSGDPTAVAKPPPTRTAGPPDAVEPPAGAGGDINFLTVATDAPSRFQVFTDIDEFGNVIGFDPGVMANLAASAGFEVEFIVTGFEGLLASVSNGEFDVAMSALILPDQPEEGLAYTIPYLEVGQVLVVRANETAIESYQDIGDGALIGVQRFAGGEQTAREDIGLSEPALQLFDSTPEALQALIDHQLDGVIIDSDDAVHYTELFPQQLKIAGGLDREAWISSKAYGIAVAEGNEALLEKLNEAIVEARENGSIERLTQIWLVPEESIDAGESLVGTPTDEVVIGIAGELPSLDPAARDPDLVSWEVLLNTMSGLLSHDAENNLVPMLAEDMPLISEDMLEYTFKLRPGLTFPDGSDLTAEDVQFSISRAIGLGNFQVNRYLKDANEDNFADADAVQVIDSQTVKIVLQEPTSYFSSVVATPPFFIVSQDCYLERPDPQNGCGGIGPYTMTEWSPGDHMRLKANPEWPGQAPTFDDIQLRFYGDSESMRRSLENEAIDVAWTGLSPEDRRALQEMGNMRLWEGASAFKSYLVFEQSERPWSNARLRQAIAYSLDREVLVDEVFDGIRRPLFSPVPDNTTGHVASEPGRDLDVATSILRASGYAPSQKLEMTIWYVDDGRYTVLEEAYATALENQLEETGLVEVTLQGAPWSAFRPASLACEYPAYLLGWPSSGQPTAYLDAMSWMEYFITNTDLVCSNYESPAMTMLLEEALKEVDEGRRLELYRQIQELWAEEYPTLDLTQESRFAVSLAKVEDVVVDSMGLLRYDVLNKLDE